MTRTESIRMSMASLARAVALLGASAVAGCSSSNGDAPQSDAGNTVDAAGAEASNPATDASANCQATITQGALMGKAAGSTCEYLGIPYGAPPTGALRFMPPKPAAGWSSPRDATAFGSSCLQANMGLGDVGPTSEDCLVLNVFTPKAAPSKPLPVMVFIHGGGFTTGSSYSFAKQPLSEHGPVVVVTINYRLGALGFLALPDLDAQRPGAPSGSDGIRDQQLALKWVHDNVATFHGDPANVTLFGESAGSTSVCLHMVSPGSQGLAHRYIMESGNCVGGTPQLNVRADSYQLGAELATSFCAADAGATTTDVLSCLRSADATMLMKWVPPPDAPPIGVSVALGNLLGAPFAPTIEGTGGVLPDTPAKLVASGSYNKDAQVLAGSNKNEFGLFVAAASNPTYGGSPSSPLNVTTAAQLHDNEVKQFGSNAPQVEAQYPATDATARQVYIDLVTDLAFRCPMLQQARAMLSQGTKSYYIYSYDVGPAWHAFELVPLFNVALSTIGAVTPSTGLTNDMLGYWTRFAATGDPNDAGDSGAPTWPAYTASGGDFIDLNDPAPMAMPHLRQAQCDFWASLPPATSGPRDGGTD